MIYIGGFIRVAIVLEDACIEADTISLGEVDHFMDWNFILDAANNNCIAKLVTHLKLDLL